MRKALLRPLPILIAGALLSGCVHAVDLVPLDGGRPGYGDVAYKGGAMKVNFEGRVYEGQFVPAESPEIVAGLKPFPGAPIATGRQWGVQGAQGHTGAVLTAEDGAKITCRFSYDPPEMMGSGTCQGQDGRNFALRMR
jgi:hypothetical protein